MKVGGDQRVQELTQGKIYIRARGMDGTLLHNIHLYQHSHRDECRRQLTHLVRLCRLRLQAYGGLWFTVRTHRKWTNIGSGSSSWTDIGASSHIWSDSAGSGFVVGSGFLSLASLGTASRFVAGFWFWVSGVHR